MTERKVGDVLRYRGKEYVVTQVGPNGSASTPLLPSHGIVHVGHLEATPAPEGEK